MSNSNEQPKAVPKPIFLLQNGKPINNALFSNKNSDILYVANREGDLTIYNLELRRAVFSSSIAKQPMLHIAELNEENLLTYSKNGSVYKWTKANTDWQVNCSEIFLFFFRFF
jgi:hypothetical protein